jgi:hypothetical protein
MILSTIALIVLVASETLCLAEEGGGAAEMARKLQDPLANIKAVMTDNVFGFNTGDDDGTSYGFQIQPIYAIDMQDQGFTFLPRAVIPIVGLEPGTRTRITGEDGDPAPSGSSRTWGLGDTVLQFFFAPHTEGSWKWGVGPQFSLATHSDSDLRGPDWGAGAAGVAVGNITESLSFAGIVGNLRSFDGDFNTGMFKPMFFYNFDSIPGAYVAYNAVISADWKADSGDTWTVPLGLSIGKTFDMGNGNGLDFMIGPYYNVIRPDCAANWTIRFGINWLFP